MSTLFTHSQLGRRSLVPPPFVRFEASTLNPATSGVNRWPNTGTGGPGWDATPAANMVAPLLLPTGGPTGGPAVQFSTGDVLATASALGIAPGAARSFFAVVQLDPAEQGRNLFGMGTAQDKQMLDVIAGVTGANPYYLHNYNGGLASTLAPLALPGWFALGYTIGNPAGTRGRTYGVQKGTLVQDGYSADTIADTPLLLGGGYYQDLNRGHPPFLLAQAEVYDLFLTQTQLLTRAQQLLRQYRLS